MSPSKKHSQTVADARETEIALSSLHERLDFLQKQQKHLLTQIKRRRTELNNFVQQLQDFSQQFFANVQPIAQKVREIDEEIHHLFEEILTNKKIGKKSLRKIEQLYHSLQRMGLITPKSFDSQEEDFDDFSGENEEEDEQWSENYKDQQRREYDRDSQEDSRSDASHRHPNIRQIFLRLAAIFHPDKATDEETKEYNTEIMKHINNAYREGDLAKLLELEKQYAARTLSIKDLSSKTNLELQCECLEKEIELLRDQLENLKGELSFLRNTQEGDLLKDYRKSKKQGINVFEELKKQGENDIEKIAMIRDFVKDFRDQKITIKDFLKGPMFPFVIQQEDLEAFFEMLF